MTESEKKARKSEYDKKRYEANREKVLARSKTFYENNKVTCKEYKKTHYKDNKEKYSARMKTWRENNRSAIAIQKKAYAEKNKKKLSKWFSEHKKANRASYNALNQKRKANKLQATPAWLTSLDLEHIKLFYEAAADQKQHGLDIHVDHIVPLQGKDVCGLHVPWNLQLLPASENIRKGNRYGQ